MAVKLDAVVDAFTFLGGNDAATFPDSDWCVGIYLKISDNSGSAFQYVFSTRNGANFTDAFSVYIPEVGSGSNAGAMGVRMNNSSTATIFNLFTTSKYGGDGKGRYWFFQRKNNDFEMYSVIQGQKPILEVAARNLSNWTTTPAGESFSIGKRNDESSTRYLKGIAAEAFKAHYSLTLDEMVELSNGKTILELNRPRPNLYLPLERSESDPANMGDHSPSPFALREGDPTTANHPSKRYNSFPFRLITGGLDTTPPVLSSPTGTKTGSTTADGTVSTDEGNGTLYFLASTNTTETAATIKAGSSQSVSATGVQNVNFTGLTANTTYYAHYVHDDAATNESNVVVSTSFITDPSSSFNPAWANVNTLIGGL